MKAEDSRFAENIERKVRNTIKKYRLFSKNEKIAVAASGGKDSTAALYILKKLGCNISAITIDVRIGSYTKKNIENLKKFCKKERIPLYIVDIQEELGCSICYLRSALNSKGINLNSCAVCGVVKRHLINKAAKSIGASKVVTGHNLDDEAQSFLMNLFRNSLSWSARLGPCPSKASGSGLVKRVKPLYFVSEKDIARYSKAMRFPVNYERCPCSSEVLRNKVRVMLDTLEKHNPKAKKNIVDYFLDMLPEIRKNLEKPVLKSCRICGEPSQSGICRQCQILSEIKPKL